MRVKKYITTSIVDALAEIKRDLGPEAIILSTKEEPRVYGQPQKFAVVAAVKEQDFKSKEATSKKLGHYKESFEARTATQQRAIIGSVVDGMKRRHAERNPTHTQVRYAEITDLAESQPMPVENLPADLSEQRVKSAVKEALRSSLATNLFGFASKKMNLSETPVAAAPNPQPVRVADFQKRPEKMVITERSAEAGLAVMEEKLRNTGVTNEIIANYLGQVRQQYGNSPKKSVVEAFIARKILDEVQCVVAGQFQGFEFFVGPEGAGKTSSLIKLASHYIMNYRRKVAIVTSDRKKVGAVEQLKVFSRILNVPVIAIGNLDEWAAWVSKLESYDNILIDTPGVSLTKTREIEYLRDLLNVHGRANTCTHLVLSAMSSTADLKACGHHFSATKLSDVIFTKIDQTSQHGVLLNFFLQFKLPFHSFGLSSDVIDGFEWATRERILDLIFRLTKINGAKSHGQYL